MANVARDGPTAAPKQEEAFSGEAHQQSVLSRTTHSHECKSRAQHGRMDLHAQHGRMHSRAGAAAVRMRQRASAHLELSGPVVRR